MITNTSNSQTDFAYFQKAVIKRNVYSKEYMLYIKRRIEDKYNFKFERSMKEYTDMLLFFYGRFVIKQKNEKKSK